MVTFHLIKVSFKLTKAKFKLKKVKFKLNPIKNDSGFSHKMICRLTQSDQRLIAYSYSRHLYCQFLLLAVYFRLLLSTLHCRHFIIDSLWSTFYCLLLLSNILGFEIFELTIRVENIRINNESEQYKSRQ